jgi:hypothetical protein
MSIPHHIPHHWIRSWPRRHDPLHRGTVPIRRVVVLWCQAGSQKNQPGS